jgi:hypothetical protein
MSEPSAPRPHLVQLDFRPVSSLSWVGPSLAVVAGSMASHRLGLDAPSLLTLILALLLADPLLGGLWSILVSADWASPRRESATQTPTFLQLPHSVAGSPAYRLSELLASLSGHDLEQTPNGRVVPLIEAGFYAASASALAAVLGAQVMLVVVAAFSLAVIRVLLGGSGQRHGWLETAYAFAAPWLVGYGAFGALPVDPQPASLVALALGVAVTLAYHGYRGLIAGGSLRGGLLALDLGQALAVLALVAVLHPWQAGVAGLLLVAQALWQPRLWRGKDAVVYARETQGFLALAVLACFV